MRSRNKLFWILCRYDEKESERLKKDLKSEKDEKDSQEEKDRSETYKSIFESKDQWAYQQSKPLYFPPDAFGALSLAPPTEEEIPHMEGIDSWDVATRYHEFRAKLKASPALKNLRRMSCQSILERAQAVLGSIVHPMEPRTSPMNEVPRNAQQLDIDLDDTLENSPLAVSSLFSGHSETYPMTEQDIWMSYTTHRQQPIILCVDTSLSMTGEKLALTAVALAVVLLEFPEDPIGIVAFENAAKILKTPTERLTIPTLIERFLDVPAQGYTHLEEGMIAALQLVKSVSSGGHGRPPSTVLLTDGKYTAGKDPSFLAPRFPHLVVLKMGRERTSLELCRELAQKGQGALREVDELESLPTIMYGVVKDLLRGRSIS